MFYFLFHFFALIIAFFFCFSNASTIEVTASVSSPLLQQCPVGTYCPGGVLNYPINCPAGRFNNVTGASVCQLCPPGTECPYEKTILPALCSPGYVCPTSGTAKPTLLCPGGLVCWGGTMYTAFNPLLPTYTGFSVSYPSLCPAGNYCLNGTFTNVTHETQNGYPHTCEAGVFCNNGASAAGGTNQCEPGYYCPRGTTTAIAVSPGFYSQSKGAIKPSVCTPGSFGPANILHTKCIPCPAGFKCPNFQMDTALICPRGFFRSTADSVTCKACPPGKWSPYRALSEGSLCQPCPDGRVCGLNGMTSLNDSFACIAGYVCPSGTNPSTQFDLKCPSGYICKAEAYPTIQYDFLCPEGYYCKEGTPFNLATRLACPENRYCPQGSTITQVGNTSSYFVPCYPEVPVSKRSNSLERCGPDPLLNITLADGYTSFIRMPNTCPFGSLSPLKSIRYEHCTPSGFTPLISFQPFVTFSNQTKNNFGYDDVLKFVPAILSNDSSILKPLEPEYYSISLFNFVSIIFDWSDIPLNMSYGVPTQVESDRSIIVQYSLTFETESYTFIPNATIEKGSSHDINRIPTSFTSKTVKKQSKFVLNLLPLINLNFRLLVQMYDSIFLPFSWSFVNTAVMNISRPSRAIYGTASQFLIFVDPTSTEIDVPYNLPWSFQESYLLGFAPNDTDQPLINRLFADSYIPVNKQLKIPYVLPYFPFFSNCRGYGAYIPIHTVFENPSYCNLVPSEDTLPVGDFDVGLIPNADSCLADIECSVEEYNQQSAGVTRWFEISSITQAFHIKKVPLDQSYLSGFGDYFQLVDSLSQYSVASDDFAHIFISRDDASATSSGIPRKVKMTIQYQQVTSTVKKIIAGTILMTDFDPAPTYTNYTLTIQYSALGWLDLLNNFAFSLNLYFILFAIHAALLSVLIFFIWIFHRIKPRFAIGNNFHFLNYAKLIVPGSTFAMICVIAPIWALMYGFYYSIIVLKVFDPYSPNWSIFESELSESDITYGVAQRVSMVMICTGFYLLFLGAEMLIPYRIKIRRTVAAENDESDIKTEAEKKLRERAKMEKAHQEPDTLVYAPRYWKRMAFVTLGFTCSFAFCMLLEFSFSSSFQVQPIAIVIILKLAQPTLERYLTDVCGEKLLVAPIISAYVTLQFIAGMGAGNFLMCMVCSFVTLFLSSIQSIYLDPWFKANIKQITRKGRKILIAIGLLKMNEEDRNDEKIARGKLPNVVTDEESDAKHVAGLVEPLIETEVIMSSETIGLFLFPLFLIVCQLFLTQCKVTKNYEIPDLYVDYYTIFAASTIFGNYLLQVLTMNVLEVVHGWKIFEYLSFLSFRFETRHSKWKAFEVNLDNQLPMGLKSLDTLCFSSQYYLIVGTPAAGIILLALGIETMAQNYSDIFGDKICFLMFPLVFIVGWLLKSGMVWFGNLLRFYTLPSKINIKTEKKLAEIPNWRRLAEMKSMFGGSEAMMGTIETARITEEAFRHRFIDFEENREWIADNLVTMLTPRFVVSLANSLATNISQMLVRVKKWRANVQGHEEIEISDDSDDEPVLSRFRNMHGLDQMVTWVNSQKRPLHGFVPSDAAITDLSVLSLWLLWVRRRNLMSSHAEMQMRRVMSDECDICHDHLSTLKPVPLNPVASVIDAFEESLGTTGHVNLDTWEKFFSFRQSVSTMCLSCFDEMEKVQAREKRNRQRDAEIARSKDQYISRMKENPLNTKDKTILNMWLDIAHRKVAIKKRSKAMAKVDSDSEDEDKIVISSDSEASVSNELSSERSVEKKPRPISAIRRTPLRLSSAQEIDEDVMLKSFRAADQLSYRHPRPSQVKPLPLSSSNLAPYSSVSHYDHHVKKDLEANQITMPSIIDEALYNELQFQEPGEDVKPIYGLESQFEPPSEMFQPTYSSKKYNSQETVHNLQPHYAAVYSQAPKYGSSTNKRTLSRAAPLPSVSTKYQYDISDDSDESNS